ncbi:MAG: bifunctional fucokinase/fucose-1-phosphate guanylyltransferase [Sphaerochaeta sp.]|nr:bifunctional fucokinase/fucose-1-phosphate guanylyltransferase [Sphaerochaeta sp.]
MKCLLSLPNQAASALPFLKEDNADWQAYFDPPESQLGSGGGTAWLLYQSYISESSEETFESWLEQKKKILVHAGGLSRRLPAYGPVGKSMIPIPVFRWERGQRLDQTLIDLQLPLCEKLLQNAPKAIHTLVVSGDALVTSPSYELSIPDADVILIAVSADPSIAMNHGVFVCDPSNPKHLLFMLQKPERKELQQVALDHLFFIDTGLWLLSDRAIQVLMSKTGWDQNSQSFSHAVPDFYDLYGAFGKCLGSTPSVVDSDLNELTVAVVPIPQGKFYHFGTSSEIISSSLELQNKITDQRLIWSRNIKPHPSIFTQNALVECSFNESLQNIWIENAHIPSTWHLHGDHVLTGIPQNSWSLDIPNGVCLDMILVGEDSWAIRPYGMWDFFRGNVNSAETIWMGVPIAQWFQERGLELPRDNTDINDFPLFLILPLHEISSKFIQWLMTPLEDAEASKVYKNYLKVSASELLSIADLKSLSLQRKEFRKLNYVHLGKNHLKSVFYQIDLRHAAKELDASLLQDISKPSVLEVPMLAMHDRMLRSVVLHDEPLEKEAFSILREGILNPVKQRKVLPSCSVYQDQIVWSRSPVRIDLAGGWTDTPPYSLLNGGDVVTVALELNGQPPLQAYIRPILEKRITLRSIDQGAEVTITDYKDLNVRNDLRSGFSIPKAALCLAGFHPDFCRVPYTALKNQLDDIGSGFELTFFSAVPRGSGMGTSSVLSATILGALSDFCGLGWDLYEIGDRTLALEQMLTSGGGWQDQYGGIFPGVKLLQTERGFVQKPSVKWLPDSLFTKPEYKDCMVLYYTGITRIAKSLLGEIVKGMFLNDVKDSLTLSEMKHHALHTAEIIQKNDFQGFGKAIDKTWRLKNRLDRDTNNQEIQHIIELIDDYSLGYVLPGAGGGGYLFIVGKDLEAANTIRSILKKVQARPNARIVEMVLSNEGMQVSRS